MACGNVSSAYLSAAAALAKNAAYHGIVSISVALSIGIVWLA